MLIVKTKEKNIVMLNKDSFRDCRSKIMFFAGLIFMQVGYAFSWEKPTIVIVNNV